MRARASTMKTSIDAYLPSRARNIGQILEYVERKSITDELLIKVGLRINKNLLLGSNHRCVAMLTVFKSIIDNYEPNHQRPLDELKDMLVQAKEFLNFCRPLSVSMLNAEKLIYAEIFNLNQQTASSQLSITEECLLYNDHKQKLKDFIDQFIYEEIWSAQKGICENIQENITTNDVILVYGCSTIVQHVLLDSKLRGKRFRVIVVDSPPHFNGRRMLNFLNDNQIDVSYTLINSLSFVMRQATKVLLGANSMLANGYVMSQIGTSQVALMAKATNVPTLVCCETYKLSDRVYVDSFGCNEVDGGHELDSALNLRYDLTPPEFVSMVINEKNIVPAESVPALLRFRAERKRNNPIEAAQTNTAHI
uniref:Translation initiation factor eIF2B subunit delta n=1 Tax=Aceria tosichella TaxID=561515 RepID=A0A6G1SFG7_9ACAR